MLRLSLLNVLSPHGILRRCCHVILVLPKLKNKSYVDFSGRTRMKRHQNILRVVGLFITLIFVLYFLKKIFKPYKSAVKRYSPAFSLLSKIGNSHLEFHLDKFEQYNYSEDLNDLDRIILMKIMRESFNSVMQSCASRRIVCANTPERDHILTLFTTWSYDYEKFDIHNRTLFNWRLLPNVHLVVFTNSSAVQFFSESAGFHVLPIPEEAAGMPVLPAMFLSVMKKFQSDFYGYANGDLLFTNTLIDTLKHIQCNLTASKRQNGVLIVGRRVNIPSKFITNEIVSSWEKLDHISKVNGSIFGTGAQDYFITDKLYPWREVLPVVVGRRAYDNWIVAFSRYHNITVIDASESIHCMHQTMESRGNFEGSLKGEYNADLIYQLKLPYDFAYWGRALCAGMKSWVNLCGDLVLSERNKLDKDCSSFHMSHQIKKLLGFLKN